MMSQEMRMELLFEDTKRNFTNTPHLISLHIEPPRTFNG